MSNNLFLQTNAIESLLLLGSSRRPTPSSSRCSGAAALPSDSDQDNHGSRREARTSPYSG